MTDSRPIRRLTRPTGAGRLAGSALLVRPAQQVHRHPLNRQAAREESAGGDERQALEILNGLSARGRQKAGSGFGRTDRTAWAASRSRHPCRLPPLASWNKLRGEGEAGSCPLSVKL